MMLDLCELWMVYKCCLIHLFHWHAEHAPVLCFAPVAFLGLCGYDVSSVWFSILKHYIRRTTVAAENVAHHHAAIFCFRHVVMKQGLEPNAADF